MSFKRFMSIQYLLFVVVVGLAASVFPVNGNTQFIAQSFIAYLTLDFDTRLIYWSHDGINAMGQVIQFVFFIFLTVGKIVWYYRQNKFLFGKYKKSTLFLGNVVFVIVLTAIDIWSLAGLFAVSANPVPLN